MFEKFKASIDFCTPGVTAFWVGYFVGIIINKGINVFF